MLDSTDPMSDDCTTRNSHLKSAMIATMSSTALPSVAFRSPARVCPTLNDISSVAKPRSWARGMMARNETVHLSYSEHAERFLDSQTNMSSSFPGVAKCSAQETGMKTRRTFIQEQRAMAFALSSKEGSGAPFGRVTVCACAKTDRMVAKGAKGMS
jgi:ERCC4-type nuclease